MPNPRVTRRTATLFVLRLHRHWRRRAWSAVRSGRPHEALALQRALVAARAAEPAVRLRDRFRLLRWELAAGSWSEAMEAADLLIPHLSRGATDQVLVWVLLARAVAQFELGLGPAYRATLARALRLARAHRKTRLYRTALLAGAAIESFRGDGARPGFLLRLAAPPPGDPWATCVAESGGDERRAWDREAEISLSRRTRVEGSDLEGRRTGWSRLPYLIAGPRPAWSLRAALRSSGAVLGNFDSADPRAARPGLALLEEWIGSSDAEPARRLPAWMASLVARAAVEHVTGAEPEFRRRMHGALSQLAAVTREPWARAALLEAVAETSLWVGAPDPSRALGAGEPPAEAFLARDAGPAIAEAKADLVLAAGLLRRLGWKARAEECERRWLRLACPGVRMPEGPRVPEAASAPNLVWVRQRLADAGFVTGDTRVIEELAPVLLLAAAPLPVLILGESGTGKEVVARAVHRWSRLQGEFVPIHCGAIPRDLLESELFGHARGAFTGASSDKQGLVEAADGGTLFLDEIGEMGSEAQMKMLRVLENGEVRRLGDVRPRRARIRLVAATHRDLEESVRAGSFRLDLFHRIRGITVRVRPLRERRGDIPLLAAQFLSEAAPQAGALEFSDSATARLLAHEWQGNVRELRGVILRGAHLARALGRSRIGPEVLGLGQAGEDTPALLPAGNVWSGPLPSREAVASAGLEGVLDEMERRLIVDALEDSGWNRTHAARRLGGLSRTTLLSKMKRLGIAGADAPEGAI